MSKSLPILLLPLLMLSGCASEPQKPHFLETTSQELAAPPADKAQVVFLEPINSIQGLFPVGLFEVVGDSRVHLATTGAHSKVALEFTPGHHVLMANHSGMIAHFLEMDVEAGKRYYVLVRFVYGRGFQLRPLRPTGPSDYSVANEDFREWVAETRFVQKTPESEAYFEAQKANVDKTQAKGWADWQKKSPAERAELTLNPSDAVAL